MSSVYTRGGNERVSCTSKLVARFFCLTYRHRQFPVPIASLRCAVNKRHTSTQHLDRPQSSVSDGSPVDATARTSPRQQRRRRRRRRRPEIGHLLLRRPTDHRTSVHPSVSGNVCLARFRSICSRLIIHRLPPTPSVISTSCPRGVLRTSGACHPME